MFETESALLPPMARPSPRGSGHEAASLPSVAARCRTSSSSGPDRTAWAPLAGTASGSGEASGRALINLAHYKHYDVQLDWHEVRCNVELHMHGLAPCAAAGICGRRLVYK